MDLRAFLDVWFVRSLALARQATRDRKGKPLPRRWAFYRLIRIVESHFRERTEPRVILIPGLRGVGKTTLLLQVLLTFHNKPIFYLPVDRLYRSVGPVLLEALEKISYELEGAKVVLLDEVTCYSEWARDLKLAYDQDPDMMIIAAGSSAMAMRFDVDLSRRASCEPLFPLSLSEYLLIRKKLGKMKRGLLGEIRSAISRSDVEKLSALEKKVLRSIGGDPITLTESFIEIGGLPATARARSKEEAAEMAWEVLDRVIRWDLVEVANFESSTLPEVERLLMAISSEKPGAVSSESLSRDIGMNKRQVIRALNALERAEVIFRVPPVGTARSKARKPWKIYFTTSTLRWGQIANLMPVTKDMRAVLLEEAVAARLHRISRTSKGASLSYGWGDGEVDLVLEMEGRRLAFEISLGKEIPGSQVGIAGRVGAEGIYMVTLRPGVEKKGSVIRIPAWLLLF